MYGRVLKLIPGSGMVFQLGSFKILVSIMGDPFKGTLLNPTSGPLNRDLIERVYIPKGPPTPNPKPSTLKP